MQHHRGNPSVRVTVLRYIIPSTFGIFVLHSGCDEAMLGCLSQKLAEFVST